MVVLDVILLVSSLFVLFKSSEYLVQSARKLAGYFDLPEFLVGFIFLAVGTSLPELAVTVSATLGGNFSLAIGNVIGSNVANIAFVLGLSAILNKGIKLESQILTKNIFKMILVATIPVFLLVLNIPNKILGAILIALFAYYVFSIQREKRFKKEIPVKPKEAVTAGIVFLPLLLLLIFSSQTTIMFSKNIMEAFNVSGLIVGLTVIAFGTSLPEFVTVNFSLKKKYNYLAWGNVLGSLVTNTTLVLGVGLLLTSESISQIFALSSFAYLFFLEAMLILITRNDNELKASDGLVFLFSYVFYILLEFLINV